jgi:suppressor of fused-like protein
MSDPDTAGWDAIDAALRRIYGDKEPMHWGSALKWRIGGPDPLDGTSVYARDDHWHYVSYGMSELYGKESDDPQNSGWGFEFTFRLARSAKEATPPTWPISFMNNLGRYVFQTGNVFAPGHHSPINGPIGPMETAIRALVFVADPELGEIDTPHGRLTFLQIVGITEDELLAVQSWNTKAFTGLLAGRDRLLRTDTGRGSHLADPDFAAAVAQGRAIEGSSTGMTFVGQLAFASGPPVRITVGALAVDAIQQVLPGRIGFDRPYTLVSRELQVVFEPAERVRVAGDADGDVVVSLPAAAASALARALKPKRGSYAVPELPGVVIEVVPTPVKDPDGSVAYTVG